MGLDLDAFTYITGIAGLLGLVLQLKDTFPQHRETRKTVVLLVLGVFLGSLVSSLRSVKVDLSTTVTPFSVLVGVFVAVLAVIVVAAVLSSEHSKREQLFMVTGLGTFALMILLFFGTLVSGLDSQSDRETRRLTIDELLEMSSQHLGRKNFDRSIFFLEQARQRVPKTDSRYKSIQTRIDDVKAKQVGSK